MKGNLTVDKHLSVLTSVGEGTKKAQEVQMSDNGWGEMISKDCPVNHFLCGMKVRHERQIGNEKRDNTGINGMALRCCPFK